MCRYGSRIEEQNGVGKKNCVHKDVRWIMLGEPETEYRGPETAAMERVAPAVFLEVHQRQAHQGYL